MLSCQVSDSVVYDPRNPADPADDAIVDEDFTSKHIRTVFRLVDGRWLAHSKDHFAPVDVGVNTCAG